MHIDRQNFDDFVKSRKPLFLSFRRKPESSLFMWLQMVWTPEPAPDPDPGFTGVTTFYEVVNFGFHHFSETFNR